MFRLNLPSAVVLAAALNGIYQAGLNFLGWPPEGAFWCALLTILIGAWVGDDDDLTTSSMGKNFRKWHGGRR